mgnify:CR=1 FL=1
MIALDQYLKGVLQQVYSAYQTLEGLGDKPGDLQTIRQCLAKINGQFSVLATKMVANKQELADYQYLLMPIKLYLDNHDFTREIETMAPLYSDDPMRLRNLRLSILQAVKENNLLEHIRGLVE